MARTKYFNKTTNKWEYADTGGLSLEYADSMYIKTSKLGAANGVAILDENGKIPNEQISDVVIFDNKDNENTSTPIQIGWLKNSNGEKISPKTLSSQIQTSDGVLLEDKIQNNLTSAKSYADTAATNAANTVKNDLLNGAGDAYDTLKELGELIDDNTDAIDALEIVATGKADKTHYHIVSDVSDLQSTLDTKFAKTGGSITGNITLEAAETGSPSIVFQRGTSSDAYTDWRIQDSVGQLKFGIRANSSDFTDKIVFREAGNIEATSFVGNLTGNADTATTLTGLTTTVAELNYVDGVTSNIQTQLNGKLSTSGGTITNSSATSILNINNSSSSNSWIYYKTKDVNKAASGYYEGLAFLSNEATYARIGVNDSGTPQYWSSNSSSTAKDLIHSGNIGSQSVNYANSAGSANSIAVGLGTTNVYRNIWFSDSSAVGKMCYDNEFKYNPATDTMAVGKVALGDSAITLQYDSTEKSLKFVFT